MKNRLVWALIVCLVLCLTFPITAQNNTVTCPEGSLVSSPEAGYQEALKRIETTRREIEDALNRVAQGWRYSGATINLEHLCLQQLPPEVFQLDVRWIHFNNNLLTSLPPEFGNFTGTQLIYLNHNLLTSLPPEFGNLTHLQVLYLDNNPLGDFPPELLQLSNLSAIFLGSTALQSIPLEIGNLSNLYALYIGHNLLTELPDTIGELSQLKTLYVVDNQLTTLPYTLANLPLLEVLSVTGNPLISPPPEVVERGTSAIQDYLRMQIWVHTSRIISIVAVIVTVLATYILIYNYRLPTAKKKRA